MSIARNLQDNETMAKLVCVDCKTVSKFVSINFRHDQALVLTLYFVEIGDKYLIRKMLIQKMNL